MAWRELSSLKGIDSVVDASSERPQLIFKHSTRGGISSGAKFRLDNSLKELEVDFDCNFLDLLAHRDISAAIAERFGVQHESPQIIAIKDGKEVFNLSHSSIRFDTIQDLWHRAD